MSSAPLIGLEMFAPPGPPDRSQAQADLLGFLRNDNFEQFEYILMNYSQCIDVNHLYEGPDNKTLLDIACSCKGKARFVECLLNSGAVVNSRNKLQGKAAIHLAVLYSDLDTLKLLVEYPGVDVNYRDKEGNTALHYAVELDDRDAITLLLDSGAHMGAQNSNGDLVVKFMRAETLEYLLDRSISSKGQLLDKDYQIIFDYSLLVSKEQRPEPVPVEETELLVALSEVVELRPMLKHPVLTSFLDLQWQNVTSGLYWRVFLIHAFLSFALTGFILMVYVPKMTIKHLQLHEGVENSNSTYWQNEMNKLDAADVVWRTLARGCLCLILLREVLQLVLYSKYKWYKDFENYLKAALIGVTCVTLFVRDIQPQMYRYYLAAVTIFLSYMELMLLISRHPVVSVNVYMFKQMIYNYLKLCLWYAAFVLAFAVSFYLTFTEKTANFYSSYTPSYVLMNITRLALQPPELFNGKYGWELNLHLVALGIYSFLGLSILFTLLAIDSMTKTALTNTELVRFVSQAKFIVDTDKWAPDLISLLFALAHYFRSIVDRRLKGQRKGRDSSRKYSAIAVFSHSSADQKVYVLVNQRNRIVTSKRKFRFEKATGSSCGFCARDWTFSKASVEEAKKILSKRTSLEVSSSSSMNDVEEVVKVVAKLQSNLLSLERALSATEEKLRNFVEDALKRTSTQDQIRLECSMRTSEDRLLHAVEDARKRTVVEITKFVREVVPQAKTDADYFYST